MSRPGDDGVRLWIIGAGRFGLSLGLALHRAGALGSLRVSGRRPTAPAHPLFLGDPPPADYRGDLVPPDAPLDGVVVAVPDDAVAGVAAALARGPLPAGLPVLHTAGALSLDALAPLAAGGHPVGSVHALAALADPVSGADRLRGAAFGVEGSGAAGDLAGRIVAACAGRLLTIRPGGKAEYHAAAVFASNYVVALLGVAEALMARAGAAPGEARAALAGLAGGAVANAAARGPAQALTGPVARGDEATLRLHLARLSGRERPLYCLLGMEALGLARAAGLDEAAARRVELVLGEAE